MRRPDDGVEVAAGEPRSMDVETTDKALQGVDAIVAVADTTVADNEDEEDEDEDEQVLTMADGGVLLTDTLKSMGADTVISMARGSVMGITTRYRD